jgi:hypothetical protein
MNDEAILAARPVLPSVTGPGWMPDAPEPDFEAFQSHVLRPVLKQQHAAIVEVFEAHLAEIRWNSASHSRQDTAARFEHELKTHLRLRATLMGMAMAGMTLAELRFCLRYRGEVQKRLTALLIRRIGSHFLPGS